MGDRTGDAGRPMLRIRTEAGLRPIGISQLQHAPESAFLTDHPIVSARGDDLVGPPSGRHLDGEDILLAGTFLPGFRDIISKGTLGLGIMGEAGFEELLPHRLSIEEQLIDTQSGRHPAGGDDLLVVAYGGQEPAGPVRREKDVGGPAAHDRRIGDGDPLGALPGRRVQSFRFHANGRRRGTGGHYGGAGRQ